MIVVRFCLLKVRVHVALHHYFLDYAKERVNNDKNEVGFQTVFCTCLVIFHFYRGANAYCLKESVNFFHKPNLKVRREIRASYIYIIQFLHDLNTLNMFVTTLTLASLQHSFPEDHTTPLTQVVHKNNSTRASLGSRY